VSRLVRALAAAGALALLAAAPAGARVREFWVAAVPTQWNAAPNGKDAITGMPVSPSDALFPTVVYRRYAPQWRSPLPTPRPRATTGC